MSVIAELTEAYMDCYFSPTPNELFMSGATYREYVESVNKSRKDADPLGTWNWTHSFSGCEIIIVPPTHCGEHFAFASKWPKEPHANH